MRAIIAVPAVAFGVLACSAAEAGLNVGVTVEGEVQPGVYGRVEIGNSPPPLVYAEPVIIVKERHRHVEPVYLHVPPGHARKWDKHCHQYDACNVPVYFVKSGEYEPRHGHHGKERHERHGRN